MNVITDKEYSERIGWSLERKIQESWHRMEQWYNWCRMNGHQCSLSFSGGLDSTVLLHLMRSNPFLKNQPIRVAFADTGLEYPEIRDFVKSTEGVEIVKAKKTFVQVIKEYGYPLVSKRVSQYVGEVQRTKSPSMVKLRLTGFRKNGTLSVLSKIPAKWHFLIAAPFKVSDRCCFFMKKQPLKCVGCPMIGVRAEEGSRREKTYIMTGCNSYESSSPRSWPIAFWRDADVRAYIAENNVSYSPIYDMGYRRTGCFPCAFGVHIEDRPNRFEMMKNTHPRLWNFCMDTLGLQSIFEWMNQFLTKTSKIHFGNDLPPSPDTGKGVEGEKFQQKELAFLD